VSTLKTNTIQAATGTTVSLASGHTPSGFVPAGGILQVKQSISATASSAFNSRTFTDIPGMSVSITPSSTSSKILVSTSLSWGSAANPYGGVRILRDSSNIAIGPNTSSGDTRATFGLQGVDNAYRLMCDNFQLLDTAVSTTSAVTYKLQWSTGVVLYLNRVNTLQSGNANTVSGVSTITVMEIAG